MNTASVAMHAGPGVQPHPLYSLAGAVLGTALVCTFLLWAFTYSLPNIPAQLMQLSLVAVPVPTLKRAPQPISHTPTPKTVTQPVTAKPVAIQEASPIKPAPSPAPLDLSLPGLTFTPQAASAFIPHASNPYSDLYREANAPPPPLIMHNGDSYRSVHGFPVVKSGGRCLALQTIQVGPSPSAHTTVGFGMPCPGEYRPSMADELKAWADKQAAKNPGGP